MKKALLSLILCSILGIAIVGCGGTSTNTKTETPQVTTETSKENTDEKKEEKKEEAIVLVDDEYATITYTAINRNGAIGPEIELLVENKSSQDITIQTSDVSADGMMADPICSIDVVQGKKAKGKLTLMKDKTDKDFKALEGKFRIVDKSFQTLKEEPFALSY